MILNIIKEILNWFYKYIVPLGVAALIGTLYTIYKSFQKPNLKLLIERKSTKNYFTSYIINKGKKPATKIEICELPGKVEFKFDRLISGEKANIGELPLDDEAKYVDYYFHYIKCDELPIIEEIKIIVKMDDIARKNKLLIKLKNRKS